MGENCHYEARGCAVIRKFHLWGTDCHTPYGGLACRLGRCFCFAEVSTGHPHRNDGISDFFAYAIYRYIPYLCAVKVSKGKFVPLVIREGPETQLKGFPAVLFPISVRTEIGCLRGTSARGFYYFEKGKRIATAVTRLSNDVGGGNGLPRT